MCAGRNGGEVMSENAAIHMTSSICRVVETIVVCITISILGSKVLDALMGLREHKTPVAFQENGSKDNAPTKGGK